MGKKTCCVCDVLSPIHSTRPSTPVGIRGRISRGHARVTQGGHLDFFCRGNREFFAAVVDLGVSACVSTLEPGLSDRFNVFARVMMDDCERFLQEFLVDTSLHMPHDKSHR